jgi:gas vesicle structural protein
MIMTSQTGLYDVVDVILDKGLVIDAFLRVSVISIELLTVDARVVVAGVDTYLRFAEAAKRLDLTVGSGSGPLGNLLGGAAPAVGAGRPAAMVGAGASRIKEGQRTKESAP